MKSLALTFLTTLILLSACQISKQTPAPIFVPTLVPPETQVATVITIVTLPPLPPTESAPVLDTQSVLFKSYEAWPAAVQKEYSTYFSDPFGVDKASNPEWIAQRDTLNQKIDAGWLDTLKSNTEWQAVITSWGLTAPDINNWNSLTSADKLLAVKAYMKVTKTLECNLPTNWIVDAHNNPANYPVNIIKNHWEISGFGALVNDKFSQNPAMELTNGFDQSYDYNRKEKYPMYGQAVYVPWASTGGYFTTGGEGIIGMVHILGMPRNQAMMLWLDVPDRRPVDQFQIVPFTALSRKGSVCLVSNAQGNNIESTCSAGHITNSGVSLGDGGAIDMSGVANTVTSDPDVLLPLLAKCAAGSCQIRIFNGYEFVNGVGAIRQVDFNPAPPNQ